MSQYHFLKRIKKWRDRTIQSLTKEQGDRYAMLGFAESPTYSTLLDEAKNDPYDVVKAARLVFRMRQDVMTVTEKDPGLDGLDDEVREAVQGMEVHES